MVLNTQYKNAQLNQVYLPTAQPYIAFSSLTSVSLIPIFWPNCVTCCPFTVHENGDLGVMTQEGCHEG